MTRGDTQLALLFGEFHNKDRILAREADQDDKPDLRKDIYVVSCQQHSGHRA